MLVHDGVDRADVAAADRLERPAVDVGDERAAVPRGQELVDGHGDALEDLVLVGGQQLAARGPAHRVVEAVVELQQLAGVVSPLRLDAQDGVLDLAQGRGVGAPGASRASCVSTGRRASTSSRRSSRSGAARSHQRRRDEVVEHGHPAVDAAAGAHDAVAGQQADRLAEWACSPAAGRHLLERRSRSPTPKTPERIAKVICSTTRSCIRPPSTG